MITNKRSIQVENKYKDGFSNILTEEALNFLEKLHYKFNERRKNLLAIRRRGQQRLDEGKTFSFLSETKKVREGDWLIDPLPEDLQDRRVEITGPVSRNMVINALNSGAKTYMACFEDATSPTWENIIEGQINLKAAVHRTIDYQADNGREYRLNKETAVLIVRPRGWHLEEKNITVNKEATSASLVDFGLYFFHNARELLRRHTGPYFYLPKLENHLEARLWNDIFIFAQEELGISRGTIKATVLIETISSAFEMDEILYELREHSAGLNCGRWDYIFSYIKKFQKNPNVIFPDRSDVTMEAPFMRAYTTLAVQTCHKRNAPAIGGMAAQIPIRDDEEANALAFAKIREDKEREVQDGHDGTWVAHPGMIEFVMDIFDKGMPNPNQIDNKRKDVHVTEKDLLEVPTGEITEEGLRTNISVGIQYMGAWLMGRGAVPINNLMEDAATAEISRAQIWQWIRHPKGVLDDGRRITFGLVSHVIEEELEKISALVGEDQYLSDKYGEAAELLEQLITQDQFAEFLTIPAYKQL